MGQREARAGSSSKESVMQPPDGHKTHGMQTSKEMSQGGGPCRGCRSCNTSAQMDTMLSWAPYLLNLFLDDCKDAQDLGTKFHYSWLMILIALIGWREPPYSYFCDRIGHFHAMVYINGEHFGPQEKKWKCGYLCVVLQATSRRA
jgi:hypothetical protein